MQKIGKEIKIGLAVIGVLVAAFGYILVRRLARPDDLPVPTASAPPATAAATQSSSDKPTIVSASDSARPSGTPADGASPSRSLFGTSHRFQASDSSDMPSDPRGSFMPAANNVAAGNGAAPITDAAASAGNTGAPTDSRATAGLGASGDGSHSLFTAGAANPPPEAAAPSAFGSANASADPFQRNESRPSAAVANEAPRHHRSSQSDAPGLPPSAAHAPIAGSAFGTGSASPASNPLGVQQAAAADATETNPLRGARDGNAPPAAAMPAAGMPAESVSSELPRSSFGSAGSGLQGSAPPGIAQQSQVPATPSRFSSADAVPPPITSSAINVPSQYATPSEPVGGSQPPTNGLPTASQPTNGQPTMAAQPVSAGQPLVAAPPPAADAVARAPGQYIVQPNDNYWTVSEKVYGTGGYFKAIYEHNRRQHSQSDRLQVGDVLDVPEVAVLEQMYPALCPKSGHDAEAVQAAPAAGAPPGTRVYSVADGDTLYEIARRELGRASRWGEIYQLNHAQLGNDFGYLRPGTQLLLPADAGAASMAREPSTTLQR